MAEVVGIIASGISIVQIAAQVAESIVSIKRYWNHVKAAPDDIKHLMRRMEALSVILHHIRDDLSRNALPDLVFDDSCIRESFELCRDGAAELEQLAKDLADTLDGKNGLKKKISAARAVMKKDDIKRLKQRLKDAIHLLSLAYQCYTNAMIRLQPDIIVARLSATIASSSSQGTATSDSVTTTPVDVQRVETSDSTSNDIVMQYYSHWISSPYWLRFLFGSFQYHRKNCQRRGQYSQRHRARYLFPEWFSTKVLDVCGYRSLSDWSVNIRTYRIVPCDAPIFEAVQKGDILQVQTLLASKEAFVTDRDYKGQTLLHEAVEYGAAEICRLLILEGASVCTPNNINRTPIEYMNPPLCVYRRSGKNLAREMAFPKMAFKKTYRYLINAGACDGLVNETDALMSFGGDKDDFQYLQQQTYTPYYDLPLSDRFRVARSVINLPDGAELVRIALLQGQFDQETIFYADEFGLTLLHIVTGAFTLYFALTSMDKFLLILNAKVIEHEGICEPTSPWRVLLRDIIAAGAPLHTINYRKNSILGHIIATCCQTISSMDNTERFATVLKILEIWLTHLYEVGVDLVCYGAKEKALLIGGKTDNNVKLRAIFSKARRWHYLDYSYGFSYGPRPEDWHFWFAESTDIFAGEFWAMVENCANTSTDDSEPPIPGSWTD